VQADPVRTRQQFAHSLVKFGIRIDRHFVGRVFSKWNVTTKRVGWKSWLKFTASNLRYYADFVTAVRLIPWHRIHYLDESSYSDRSAFSCLFALLSAVRSALASHCRIASSCRSRACGPRAERSALESPRGVAQRVRDCGDGSAQPERFLRQQSAPRQQHWDRFPAVCMRFVGNASERARLVCTLLMHCFRRRCYVQAITWFWTTAACTSPKAFASCCSGCCRLRT